MRTRPDCHGELRRFRASIVGPHAQAHGGVVLRSAVRAEGITRDDVRTEVDAARWARGGRRTLIIGSSQPLGEGVLWHAVWETGRDAILDGASALIASGLTGFTSPFIDVSIPGSSRRYDVKGVRPHVRRVLDPHLRTGIPRSRPEYATIRAAEWAVSDAQAALLLCMPVQQRLVGPAQLLNAWGTINSGPRHTMIGTALHDICRVAESLGELDFAAECRKVGLPEPTRQRVVQLAHRTYLDVEWEDVGLVVEIDGGHHAQLLTTVADSLRQNALVLMGRRVIRVPVIGFRLRKGEFMQQVIRAHQLASEGRL